MAANDELISDGGDSVSQVRSPGFLEFYDPGAYLAAVYPSALEPPKVAVIEPEAVAAVDVPSLAVRSQEHSRRAAKALAEVHSTARERGLLKPPSAAAASTGATVLEVAGVGDDASGTTSERLQAVANWLRREGDISGLFLLDEKGYSLLPESDGSVGDDVVLHDLGLRLAAVLDLVPERLERSPETFQQEAPIARMSLDGSRSLAIMRVAPDGALLAWIEASTMPLAASLAKLAKARFLALLNDAEEVRVVDSLAAVISDAP